MSLRSFMNPGMANPVYDYGPTDYPANEEGNVIPKTTTIQQDANGDVTVTNEHKIDAATAKNMQQAPAQAPQTAPSALIVPNPAQMANAPAMPVAPDQMDQSNAETQRLLAANAQAGAGSAPPPQQVNLPQAGPGVQVAGGPPGAGVAQAAQAAQARSVAPQATPQTQAQPPQPTNAVMHPDAVTASLAKHGSAHDVNPAHSPEENAIHHEVLNSPVNDGNLNALGMAAYAPQGMIDPATKKAYNDEFARRLEAKKGMDEAQKKADSMIRNGGVGLQRALGEKGEEGSYLKAYLFQRLGLNDLAKNEQQKLGAGDQWSQTLVNGKPAWVKYNGQGAPVKGYTAEGELTGNELLDTIGMKGATTHIATYKDKTTGQLYQLQTTALGPRYVGANGQAFSGDTANLMAYGIGADVERKNVEQLQSLRNRLLNEPKIEAAKKLAIYNAENNTNYTLDQVINSQPAMTATTGGTPTTGTTPAPATPVAPGAGTTPAPAGAAQPVAPAGAVRNNNPGNIRYGDAAQQMGATGQDSRGFAIFPDSATGDKAQDQLLNSAAYKNMNLHQIISKWAPNNENNPAQYAKTVKGMLGGIDMDKTYAELTPEEQAKFRAVQTRIEHGTGASAGGAVAPGTAPSATPGVPGSEGMRKPLQGESPAQYDAYKKAFATEQKELSEGVAKVKLKLPEYQSTADKLLTDTNRLLYKVDANGNIAVDKAGNPIEAPGYQESVGVKGWKQGFGLWNPLPGTAGRDWKNNYDQVQKEQFMLAFEKLKGAGAISDREGAAATQAQSALGDPGISEEAFKRNVQILQDTIKRGVNRQRVLTGQEPDPKYMTGGTPQQNKQAWEWVKAHPDDPKAAAIKERLGLQ